jgi:tRNA(adenine34) deaminase
VNVDERYYMTLCLKEAARAFDGDEVPVGAVIVSPDGKVIARAHNLTLKKGLPTAHAEIVAIEKAAKRLGNHRLLGCTLVVSKEPCIMCAGAIVEARIRKVIFGCYDIRRGALGSMTDVNQLGLNHKVEVQGGLLAEESEALLKRFFQLRRGTEVAITGPTRNRLYA